MKWFEPLSSLKKMRRHQVKNYFLIKHTQDLELENRRKLNVHIFIYCWGNSRRLC